MHDVLPDPVARGFDIRVDFTGFSVLGRARQAFHQGIPFFLQLFNAARITPFLGFLERCFDFSEAHFDLPHRLHVGIGYGAIGGLHGAQIVNVYPYIWFFP